MQYPDAIGMMRRCREEIIGLRRANSELAPKAEAYELLKHVMSFVPRNDRGGMSEDIVWKLDREIERAEAAIAEAKRAAEAAKNA